MADERQFLDDVAKTYRTNIKGISKWGYDSYIKIYKKYLNSAQKGLELGCSVGYSIKQLSQLVDTLEVVDGSRVMIESLPNDVKKLDNVKFTYSLFEDLTYEEKFDAVFCSYVLEHIQDTTSLIQQCYKMLIRGGRCFITVPNATAFSRQMAKKMGIVNDLYALTENDLAHGHRRVFDLSILKELIENNTQFKIIDIGGTFFKPFADFQMNKMIEMEIISEEQLIGLQGMAADYPEFSGSIYAICEKQ